MNIYGTQPERALQIIDSAELLGNLTVVKADYLRALVYSRSIESMQYDSAILIAERLMENDEVLANGKFKEEVLEVLLNGQLMQLTKDEANTEWNSFLASVANIVVTLNDNSYYTVKFNRVEEKDGQFTPVEKVGEKTWGTKPAQ